MKLSLSPLVASALLIAGASATTGAAFISHSATAKTSPSDTRLFISSWGSQGPPSRRKEEIPVDPSKDIQSYLTAPELPALRPNLGDVVLVSGFANDPDRSDQRIFDLLNDIDGVGMGGGGHSPFNFGGIVAFVDDASRAKKRLMSRTARYSGLLNKLSFVESGAVGALPTVEQLAGVSSWVAMATDITQVADIAALAEAAGVECASVLLTGPVPDAGSLEAGWLCGAMGPSFTVVAVGEMDDEVAEGSFPYAVTDLSVETTVGEGGEPSSVVSTYSRDEGYRLAAECLGLDCAAGKALAFVQVHDVNATATKVVRGLREAGYSWSQELEHMIGGGVEAYETACQEYASKMESVPTEEEGWMEREERKLREAQEAEIAAQRERDEMWEREREEMLREERERMESGLAEWA